MKCKRESDGRAFDHQTLEVLRMQAIKAVGRGQSVKDIAAAYGVNTRTIYRWLSQFASGGQKALHAKPIPGRPPKVTPDEMRWIARAVRDECPQQFKFPYGLWTLSLIGKLIERKFGKSLSLASVSRIMKLLGFSAQRPLYQAWQQDPVLVQKWESETYPEISAEARRVGASIYFADEAGVRSDYPHRYHLGTGGGNAGGAGHRQALRAQHDLSGQPARRVPVHAPRRHGHRSGVQAFPAATADRGETADLCHRRRPPHP